MNRSGWVIESASLDKVLPLRHAVLRPGLPVDSARFGGDHDAGALHLAARDGGDVVGCVSLLPSVWDEAAAFQLRGMAVDTTWRSRGVGRAMLIEVWGRTRPRPVWCHARVEAADFYVRHGWRAVSEVFELPGVGPHYTMLWATPIEPESVRVTDRHPAPGSA